MFYDGFWLAVYACAGHAVTAALCLALRVEESAVDRDKILRMIRRRPLVAGVVAPVAEEVFFRFLPAWLLGPLGVWLTSVVFAGMHETKRPVWERLARHMPWTLVICYGFLQAMEVHGLDYAIGVSCVAHAVNNSVLVAIVLLYYGSKPKTA
jgi:hypothetical protein